MIDDDPALHELVAAGLPERYRLLHAHTGRDGVDWRAASAQTWCCST